MEHITNTKILSRVYNRRNVQTNDDAWHTSWSCQHSVTSNGALISKRFIFTDNRVYNRTLVDHDGLMCSKHIWQKRNEAIDDCPWYKTLLNFIYCNSQSFHMRVYDSVPWTVAECWSKEIAIPSYQRRLSSLRKRERNMSESSSMWAPKAHRMMGKTRGEHSNAAVLHLSFAGPDHIGPPEERTGERGTDSKWGQQMKRRDDRRLKKVLFGT